MKQYLGIITGGLYGFLFRLLGEFEFGFEELVENFYSLSSITFIWIVPMVVGVIPIFIARDKVGNSRLRQFFFPLLSVLFFFLLAFSTRLEDAVCILIMSLPFLLMAGFSGLILSHWIKRQNEKKMYVILFLPLLLSPLESLLPTPQSSYEVKNEVVLEKSPAEIWQHLTEVPEIREEEYAPGFFNRIGLPRPVKSQLEVMDGKTYRVGYFSDGLKLVESISYKDSLKALHFRIHMDKSTLRDLPMDKHILGSGYFQFTEIAYQLEALSPHRTRLSLSCSYSIHTRFNFYGNFWAKRVIGDFEKRLLEALKGKLED